MYMRQGIQEKEDEHNLEEWANATICLDEEDELVGGRISLAWIVFPTSLIPKVSSRSWIYFSLKDVKPGHLGEMNAKSNVQK